MLEGFAAMHGAMRRDLARLPLAVAAADRRSATALVRWFRCFRHAIEVHHTREDDVVWPRLAERSRTFDAVRPALEQEHQHLDAALEEAAGALAELARTGDEGDRTVAQRAIDALTVVLLDHLAREEDAALGEIARCFTQDEWAGLERELMRRTPLRAIAFEAPWSLSTMDPAVQEDKLAVAPAPLRLLFRWGFVPRYQRLVRAAGM